MIEGSAHMIDVGYSEFAKSCPSLQQNCFSDIAVVALAQGHPALKTLYLSNTRYNCRQIPYNFEI